MNRCVSPTFSVTLAGEMTIIVRTGSGVVAGAGFFTVTSAIPVTVPFPAVIAVPPAAIAVKIPLQSIVPTVSSLLVHVKTIPGIRSPYWSYPVASNRQISSISGVTSAGETSIERSSGGSSVLYTAISETYLTDNPFVEG